MVSGAGVPGQMSSLTGNGHKQHDFLARLVIQKEGRLLIDKLEQVVFGLLAEGKNMTTRPFWIA